MRDIPGLDGRYAASREGHIYSRPKSPTKGKSHSGIWLKQYKHRKGYTVVSVCIDGKARVRFVHRLVALAFIPNPFCLPQINHKNGIKTDNRVENLEWCSAAQNIAHAIRTGATNTRAPAKLEAARRNAVKARAARSANRVRP